MKIETSEIEAIAFSIEGDWIVISMYAGGKLLGKPRMPFNFFVEAFMNWLEGIYGKR